MKKALSIGDSLSGNIQCRAVIDRSSHEGQAKSDVNGATKTGVLEDRQTLVVVHRKDDVTTFQGRRIKGRVGRNGAVGPNALRIGRFDCRLDFLKILTPEMPAFSCMGVEAQDLDSGLRQAEMLAQVMVNDLQCFQNSFFGDLICNGPQRQMRGHQRDSKRFCGQEHHDARAPSPFSEKFSMAAEGYAGVIDHAFVHGSGHQRLGCIFLDQASRLLERCEHVACVGLIQLPWVLDMHEWHGAAHGPPGLDRASGLPFGARYIESQSLSAAPHQVGIGDKKKPEIGVIRGQAKRTFRPDACGFARCDRQDGEGHYGLSLVAG